MWGECGGTLSAYRRNAPDPAICCPINGVCNLVSTAHWQCQPKGWKAPAAMTVSYAPECSTDRLVGDGRSICDSYTCDAKSQATRAVMPPGASKEGCITMHSYPLLPFPAKLPTRL